MKRHCISFCGWLLLCGVGVAQAQVEPAPSPLSGQAYWDAAKAAFSPVVEVPLAQGSTDDYLLSISREAGLNVLADAALYKGVAPPLAGQWDGGSSRSDGKSWKGAVGNLFLELAAQRQLTQRLLTVRTMLFWGEPDLAAVGQAITEERVRPALSGAELWRSSHSSSLLKAALAGYFTQSLQWDGGQVPPMPPTQVDQLPPDLRAALGQAVADELRGASANSVTTRGDTAVFDEAFWRGAVLHTPQDERPDVALAKGQIFLSGPIFGDSRGAAVISCPLSAPSLFSLRLHLGGKINPEQPEQGARDPQENVPAAPPPQPGAQDVALGAAPEGGEGQAVELSGQADLAVSVSSQLKRLPVEQVLAAWSQSSGVKLSAQAGPLAAHLVTVGVREMPLREAMRALSSLLAARWLKNADSYELRATSEAAAGAASLGDPYLYRYWQQPFTRQDAPRHLPIPDPPALIENIGDEVDAERLLALPLETFFQKLEARLDAEPDAGDVALPFGLPFRELSPPLQQELKQSVQADFGLSLATTYAARRQRQAALQGPLWLSVAPSSGPPAVAEATGRRKVRTVLPSPPLVALLDGAGNIVLPLKFNPAQAPPAPPQP